MQKTFIAATLAALAVASVASGAVVANWTFETSIPTTGGPHAAEAGVNAATSFASGVHASTSAVYSNPVGNGSAESFSSNFWSVGDYYQYSTSTAGYNNITITFDQTSSNTGPRDFNIEVSVNGGAFSSIGSYAVLANAAPNTPWSSISYNAAYTVSTSVAGGSNAASLVIRMVNSTNVSANGGVVATAGTSRMDSVIVSGDLIPTPGAVSLVGLGGLVAMRRRR